jgi:competence ComEA-like helix-hairpin-helix protein
MDNVFSKNYFGFNKQQRNGLFVLLIICFLLMVVRFTYPILMPPSDLIVQNLPLFERQLDSNEHETNRAFKNNFYGKAESKKRFVFDPNTVSESQLLALGFSEKSAGIFLKFRARGFEFKTKEDLKKVFGISKSLYGSLEPFIHIQNKSKPAKEATTNDFAQKYSTTPKNTIVQFELNTADSLALESLPGIGSVYAKRILQYRNMLGGFTNAEQLKEVYGFKENSYELVKKYFTVNPASVKKINLNTDDFKSINKHPYLSFQLTKDIFAFRKNTAITDKNLRELLADDSLYFKLLPYLVFD